MKKRNKKLIKRLNKDSKCGKVRYRDQIGAMLALSSTYSSRSDKRDETRYYKCPDCKVWHLTSRKRKERFE